MPVISMQYFPRHFIIFLLNDIFKAFKMLVSINFKLKFTVLEKLTTTYYENVSTILSTL